MPRAYQDITVILKKQAVPWSEYRYILSEASVASPSASDGSIYEPSCSTDHEPLPCAESLRVRAASTRRSLTPSSPPALEWSYVVVADEARLLAGGS